MSTDPASHKREVNDMMREGLRTWDSAHRIFFFCECADPRCSQVVQLALSEYDEARKDPDWRLVFGGHRDAFRAKHAGTAASSRRNTGRERHTW